VAGVGDASLTQSTLAQLGFQEVLRHGEVIHSKLECSVILSPQRNFG